MKHMSVPVWLSIALAAAGAPGGYRTTPGGAPPGELAQEIREALVPKGVRVVDSRGYRFCEVWLREAGLESGSFEEAIRQEAIPEGVLLGAIEYQAPSADRRGRGFGRGVYVLRYMGGDTVALIPAAADRDLDPPDGLAPLAKGLLRWTRLPDGAAPRLEMDSRGEWILHLRAGELTVGLLITGVASR